MNNGTQASPSITTPWGLLTLMSLEVVVHIYCGIVYSHTKEGIRVRSSEVDDPKACYTVMSENIYIYAHAWI